MKGLIPEIINKFNVYNEGTQYLGVSGAVQLPNLDAIMETISGAGILGEYETAVPGHFSSMQQEVPFRILEEEAFDMVQMDSSVNLTFRASEQSTVKATGGIQTRGMRVVERGRFKAFNAGSFENGKQMGASVTLEILYFMVEIAGKQVVELDKLNSVFKVNGKDMLAKINAYA